MVFILVISFLWPFCVFLGFSPSVLLENAIFFLLRIKYRRRLKRARRFLTLIVRNRIISRPWHIMLSSNHSNYFSLSLIPKKPQCLLFLGSTYFTYTAIAAYLSPISRSKRIIPTHPLFPDAQDLPPSRQRGRRANPPRWDHQPQAEISGQVVQTLLQAGSA